MSREDNPRRTRAKPIRQVFDAEYYRRFYLLPGSRAHDRGAVRRMAALVAAYCQYQKLRPRSILDAGCGLGWWREPLLAFFPKAQYTGLEISDYLCAKYGWMQSSVADFRAGKSYDLVICQSVLQYLDEVSAAKAIANLSRLCRGVLSLEILTREDWDKYCDKRHTDNQVFLRPVEWYRTRLRRGFHDCGSGIFLSRKAGRVLYALESGG